MGNHLSKPKGDLPALPPLQLARGEKEYNDKRLKKAETWAAKSLKPKRQKANRGLLFDIWDLEDATKDARNTLRNNPADSEELSAARNTVWQIEEMIFKKTWEASRGGTLELNVDAINRKLTAARKLAYLCRYNDYTAMITTELRAEAAKLGFDEQKLISATYYWTSIDDEIREESLIWYDLEDEETRRSKCPHTWIVHQVAEKCGWLPESCLIAINVVAERNRNAHSGFEVAMQKKNDQEIARILYTDARDLESLVPSEFAASHNVVKEQIERLRKKWFIEHTPGPDGWVATDALNKEMAKAAGEKEIQVTDPAKLAELAEALRVKEEEAKKTAAKNAQKKLEAFDDQILALQLLDQVDQNHLPAGVGIRDAEKGKANVKLPEKSDRIGLLNEYAANRKKAHELKEKSHTELLSMAMKDTIDRQRHLNARSELYRRKFGWSSENSNNLAPNEGEETTADRQRRIEARQRMAAAGPSTMNLETVRVVDPFADGVESGVGGMFGQEQ